MSRIRTCTWSSRRSASRESDYTSEKPHSANGGGNSRDSCGRRASQRMPRIGRSEAKADRPSSTGSIERRSEVSRAALASEPTQLPATCERAIYGPSPGEAICFEPESKLNADGELLAIFWSATGTQNSPRRSDDSSRGCLEHELRRNGLPTT